MGAKESRYLASGEFGHTYIVHLNKFFDDNNNTRMLLFDEDIKYCEKRDGSCSRR